MTVRRMGPATLVVAPRPAEPPAMLRRPDASSTGTSDARHAGWPAQCTWRRTARLPRAWPAAAATDGAPGEQQAARYAIIGAGLAGVATAWHLLKAHQQRRDPRPVQLHLFDAWGIASGGSGAAAGLLHPFSPKGKVRRPLRHQPRHPPAVAALPRHAMPSSLRSCCGARRRPSLLRWSWWPSPSTPPPTQHAQRTVRRPPAALCGGAGWCGPRSRPSRRATLPGPLRPSPAPALLQRPRSRRARWGRRYLAHTLPWSRTP